MGRFALSLILVSLSSALAFGCAGSDSINGEDDGDGQAAELADPGCVYASTGHVIMCVPPPASTPSAASVDCDALGAKLDAELAKAQVCVTGEDPPPNECKSWVPVRTGCEEPVYEAETQATKQYLSLWNVFAAVCPVPHPPCPYPGGLATACEANTPTGKGMCRIDDGTHLPNGD